MFKYLRRLDIFMLREPGKPKRRLFKVKGKEAHELVPSRQLVIGKFRLTIDEKGLHGDAQRPAIYKSRKLEFFKRSNAKRL